MLGVGMGPVGDVVFVAEGPEENVVFVFMVQDHGFDRFFDVGDMGRIFIIGALVPCGARSNGP
jgi:hypothetical protein